MNFATCTVNLSISSNIWYATLLESSTRIYKKRFHAQLNTEQKKQ
jgi:hypothetical protein